MHNICYLLQLMQRLRAAICNGTFISEVRNFVRSQYPKDDATRPIPNWIVDALTYAKIWDSSA